MLALTHVSSRYGGAQLRDEARAVFAATEAPRDFDTIDVPFPARGGAVLERWSDRQARERAAAGERSSEQSADRANGRRRAGDDGAQDAGRSRAVAAS
jgi:hypothetical protein